MTVIDGPVAAIGSVFKLAPAEIVAELVDRLGPTLTAALGGVTEARRVADWAAGGSEPRRLGALIASLQATRAISQVYDDVAARQWFVSTNQALGMSSPLVALRKADSQGDYDAVVVAAVQDVS